MTDVIELKVTGGPMKGRDFPFAEHNTFIFGRDIDCHAYLPADNFVSRHHFIIETDPPNARLWDLGSLNGTYVNKKFCGGRVAGESPEEGAQRNYLSVDLKDGDVIHVGETRIAVRINIDAPTEPSNENKRCNVCRKNVADEFGNRVKGNYICEQCRRKSGDDRIGLFASLETIDEGVHNSTSLDDYEIGKQLGEGGMGAVYQAIHVPTGESVAVKVILNTVPVKKPAVDKFLREIEVLKSLTHPNIVMYRGGCARKGGLFLAMEYCNRGDAGQYVTKNGGILEVEQALPIMSDTLKALAFAHEKGIVHRDIKPGNILLDEQSGVLKAKICDFGLAKSYETAGMSGMTLTKEYGGTLAYVPSEQITNYKYVKPVSDVWSLGATFYNMLTGEYPRDFTKNDDPINIILENKVIPIGKRANDIPRGLAKIIDQAIAPNPQKRFKTGSEFLAAFKVYEKQI